MKSKNRVKGYKEGTKDWDAEYNMLLEDGATCGDCLFYLRCKKIIGRDASCDRCDFYPNCFVPNNVSVITDLNKCKTIANQILSLLEEEWTQGDGMPEEADGAYSNACSFLKRDHKFTGPAM